MVPLLYCIAALVCAGQTTSSVFEMFREACPYSNFCTRNSLKSFNKTGDNMPCCYGCFCDEHCSLFGDCCPDYVPNRANPNSAILDCKPVYVVTERTKTVIHEKYAMAKLETKDLYRMIDFCPSVYKDDPRKIENCNGTFQDLPSLADLVLVSDKTGRIFKNKYCADCNGVQDTTSWSLKILACVEDISTVQLKLSETRFFIVNYCMVTSERPRGIHVTPRMFKCPESLNCDDPDKGLVDACFNGPYMPYLAIAPTFGLFRNVFCYKICFGRPEMGMCPNYYGTMTKFTSRSYQVLLDLRSDQNLRSPIASDCGEDELMDQYTVNEECTMMYIGDRIKRNAFHQESETWLLENRFYEMEGRYSFYEDPPLNLDESFHRDTLLRVQPEIIRLSTIEKFFLCPYFKLSFEEYLDHVEKHGKFSKEYQIKDVSPSSQYIEGFYPLTQNGVVVCVDTYLPRSGMNIVSGHAVYVLVSVYVISFTL